MADKFPMRAHDGADRYCEAYRDSLIRAWASIDASAVARAATLVRDCLLRDAIVYACGNGGAAAIANHLLCDFQKGVQTGTARRPRIVSLSAPIELMTAIANDISYDDVFAYQLRTMARPGDLLFTISASGNSENIVRAATWAKTNAMQTVALTGFSGGRSANLADVVIHVDSHNYGIVEDIFQSMMHVLAQYLRQSWMKPEDIATARF
jgi:D-sedoheptulose 7-phosphate isomerase